ncbi:uncharacterized protein N7483_000168 [Penicillium malachiteum]|uniref:uncharacterized protein n=1 Tax=Penicillium malachiteum TaxID=1324776 RepID=UPI002548DA41|nr:uncharacterized protein N7483_000168 [Penicillium malachiteum]KAJ5735043.1 hypothetical protein N7483_000168 [Penicillium malachiteum]
MFNDSQAAGEPIAIVGSACRFPGGATSPSKLWDLLENPHDVLSEIPNSRFNADAFYHPDSSHHGTSNVRHSYILSEDPRLFDAQFFGTKPVEANSIDPQQRLLLETVYEGLESAGIPIEKLQGSDTGVYVGLMTNDYADLLGRDIQNFPTYFASGTARSILSNRVSYFFNWHGPSMTIDTACSSSLVAVHQGVQSLRNGESKVAVVAGTNLLLGPEQYVAESKLKMLSPTGRSRMWDKDADGYARGDGIAVAILKPLSAALADGDHIECLIRETGINQDGRTKGITMPNPIAQADLIRKTYARAGLDLSNECDRPQYFEAHGTGTPAGDPVEAEAISKAFFGNHARYHRKASEEAPLYVGSIKTVIGHTEGTAGLAAVLKASLALQHGVIPPNLLLNELNPAVRPFYNDLQILKHAKQWPRTGDRTTRRASVNSFGFGGANAHAILESFETLEDTVTLGSTVPSLTPFNFSASSERSLSANLETYSEYVSNNPEIDLRDLAWTLNCRRSTLPVRVSISASDSSDLAAKLKAMTQSPSEFTPSSKSSSIKQPKYLGIFTGQGAQWAGMGSELLRGSSLASDCIASLDSALQGLPLEHRPQWTLKEEILKDASSSRIGQALFSQTLCTAIQIMLVDLLRAAGIIFTAVVGHSSGEISAAYAAGYLSADDAIKIAYYRGWSLQYSSDSTGNKGAMMAVGTSLEDAQELCRMPTLDGRICVAASNSSASVTVSGDADAIDEMKEVLEDEKKFARLLKVDKAYHSHHMLPCATPYIEAVQRSRVSIRDRSHASTTWISSVYGKDIDSVNDSLADTYWSNNMINPVLFSQAVSFAVGALGPFDMAIEVGPHPALKGPALQTIQEVSGNELPYSGTCARGKDSTQAFSSALGAVWTYLGEHAVDFSRLDDALFPRGRRARLLKGLPAYSWDHDRIYWHESRISTAFRDGNQKFHPLLGVKCPDGTQKGIRWRNYLNTREIPWLVHHQVQGQMVFPAAGYISAAVELLLEQFGGDSIRLVEFRDVIIGQALVLEENTGVEVVYSLNISDSSKTAARMSFNCYSDANKGSSEMSLHASAQIQVELGDPDLENLPPGSQSRGSFLEVETDRFYDFVSQLGFGYTGPFQALSDLKRRMDEATGMIAVPRVETSDSPLLVHPGSLDAAIQAIMLAYSFPGDGRLRSLYLPTKIDSIRINLNTCMQLAKPGSKLPFHASVANSRFSELSGDVDLYSSDGKYTVVQLQGLHTTPLVPLTSATDIPMFTEMQWAPEQAAECEFDTPSLTSDHKDLSFEMERVAHFYLKKLHLSMSDSNVLDLASNHAHLLAYSKRCISKVNSGNHPYGRLEWSHDTASDILEIVESRYPQAVDMKLMQVIGDNLPSIVRGETNLLELLMKDNLMNRFYAETLGIQPYLNRVAQIAAQISNRFPQINVLEIGAGAGETTHYMLDGMQSAFASYTYTDFWDTHFDQAQERFQEHQSRMAYKVLDIEKDVLEQGFSEESFDLVIASLALYATTNLEATLSNVRRLIKPGGYLILLELTNPDVMRFGLVLGSLPAWWMGYSEGRTLSPCISTAEWSALMKRTGFSGTELLMSSDSNLPIPFSVMLTQAVDPRMEFLRNPLSPSHEALGAESLTIIGGNSSLTTSLAFNIKEAVYQHYSSVRLYCTFDDISLEDLPVMGSVLCLSELDENLLVSMTPSKLAAFQELFKKSKNILWVGHGAQGENPYANMITGIQRTLHVEMPHLRVQFMNLQSLNDAEPQVIAQKVLQLEASGIWEQRGQIQELLWYTEPQISLHNGKVFILRLKLHSDRNDRYNSSKRLIVKNVDREIGVSVRRFDDEYHVLKGQPSALEFFGDQVRIHVIYSTLRAVKISDTDQLFLVAGTEFKTSRNVVAFSRTLDSCVDVPSSWMISYEPGTETLPLLLSLYTNLLIQAIFDNVRPGTCVGVLEPDFSMASSITQYAAQRGMQVVLLTTQNRLCCSPWIYMHQNSTSREITKQVPQNIVTLVNLGGGERIVSVLRKALPSHCNFETESSLTSEATRDFLRFPIDETLLVSRLKAAWANVQNDTSPLNMNRVSTSSLRDLIKAQPEPEKQAIIKWEEELPLQVLPATKTVKFANNKTYWLVGLTGGLGLSLCQWMASQGARYIALSSRNPKLDENWILEMAAIGCTVRIFANDITDRESVRKTYDRIIASMPAIGGVAQGAMVLQDTMFLDLDLARLDKVFRPKIQGSILLDELFSEDTLDFMIFFSSMAAVTGNPGQVAYNAANMFMNSLAAQRRSRGLAGYAINIGAIVGNGYVTRELNMDQQNYLYRVGHSWMSEQDFREVFAEGVLSCRERTGSSSELCSSLRIDDDESKNWVANPIFQHLVTKSNSFITSGKKNKAGVMLKIQLLEASSSDEVMEIVQSGFLVKLSSALQADPDKIVIDLSLDEYGVDSLNAVELRSWFLKEIGVDMPVLKILNAASIKELLEFALTLIPEALIPNVGTAPAPADAPPNATLDIVDPLSQKVTPRSDFSKSTSMSGSSDESKEFNLGYFPSHESTVNSSAASTKADSSSEQQDEASSSASSVDDSLDVTMVEKREVQRTIPMSYGQSRFYFLKSFVEDKTAFNVTPVFEVSGKLRVEDFARAVELVGQRHEALRTFFFTNLEKQPMQGILTKSNVRLERALINDESEVEVAKERMKSHIFNIADGEILRIQLLSLRSDKHWLVIGFDHINMDGLSFEVFWSELERVYNGAALSQDMLQYPDFTLRQRREYESGAWEENLSYWRSEFKDIPPVAPLLPFSKHSVRPQSTGFGSHEAHMRLDKELSDKIKACAASFKVTPYHFHLAIWQIFLLRLFDIDDICIGLGDGNRTDPDVKESIGLFLNLVPIRFRPKSSQSFGEALKDTRLTSQSAFAHGHVPLSIILSELDVPRSTSHSPLFQVSFNYRPGIADSRKFCGCTAKGSLFTAGGISYDLHLDVVDVGGGETSLYMVVQENLYKEEHADLLLRGFHNLLQAFLQNPAVRVPWPSLFSQDDIQKALNAGRGPEIQNPWPATLVHRVEHVSTSFPNRVALKEPKGVELTYSQLACRIRAIVNELVKKGVQPGGIVGVFQSPGADWICSMMAVWYIGGTYVPLDKKAGMDRLAAITSTTSFAAIITDQTTTCDLNQLGVSAEALNVSNIPTQVCDNVTNLATETQVAVIMYTSGSTGVPKGIMIRHAEYSDQIYAFNHAVGIQEATETILHQSSYTWDMSIFQILISLASASTLVIADAEHRLDPADLTSLIQSEKVTTTIATPTEYLSWFRHGRLQLESSTWTSAISGGEMLSDGLIQEFQSLGKAALRLINAYGPAEATMACSAAEVSYMSVTSSPEGLHTLPNNSVYIVDENLEPVPIGIPGELIIGGAGIAKGYLDTEKTKERFGVDQHASPFFQSKGWTMIHRSGDRARLTQDGGLVLMGRIGGDTQVKINGIRINVEEIESAIIKSSEGKVLQAVVSLRSSPEDDTRKFIVAFVVLNDTCSDESQEQFLTQLHTHLPLPKYMLPAAIIPIDSIPQNTSGKVDRFAVSDFSIPRLPSTDEFVESIGPLEDTLRQIWQETIPRDIASYHSIHSQSEYFHSGGSSLSLVNLQSLVKERLGVSVTLPQLFEASTLQGMASLITNVSPDDYGASIDWDEEIESLLASSQSKSLWSNTHNKPSGAAVVVLTGATGFIGKEVLQNILDDDLVQAVHCVAVRKPRTQLPEIFSHPKVHVYEGNLGSPQLGLSNHDAASIFSQTDVIIHNGADVSFMKTYQSLKLTNVASTKELVRLALPRRIPFHFISSASVTRLASQESFGETSLADFPPSSGSRRWVHGSQVERAGQRFGLPVWIHRPSSVQGNNAPELDLMSNVMRYCQDTKKIPDTSSWPGGFDLITVESVASQILEAVHLSGSTEGNNAVHFRYESGEIELGQEEVKELMESGTGEEFELVTVSEWVDLAEKAGMSPLLGMYLRKAKDGQVLLPRLIKGSR